MNFLVIDLETTGLSPQTDEIIEIGAVKIIDNCIDQTFQTFVKPTKSLSGEISDLTGITAEMLQNAPSLKQAIEMLQDFAKDNNQSQYFWVAHNKDFESAFLNRLLDIQPMWLDTIDIAKVALPTMRYYRLSYLMENLSIEHKKLHRALADAEATAKLLLFLQKKLHEMPGSVWKEFIEICGVLQTPLAEFCRTIYMNGLNCLNVAETPVFDSAKLGCIDLDSADYDYQLPLEDISNFFQQLPDTEYETRPEQIQMSKLVTTAFNKKNLLMIEAGTGTGKSLAYLLPAVLYSKGSNQQIVISTNTINLQDQLLNKDIPLLKKELNEKFYALVIKGRGNYICLRKWHTIKSSTTIETLALHLRIAHWLNKTTTGDISELNLWGRDLDNVQELNAVSETCLNFNCQKNRNNCYVTKIRKKAHQANLLIINHSLLLSASLYSNDTTCILPPVRHLIVDEAHQLVTVAQRQFSAKFSSNEIKHKLGNIWQRCKVEELLRVLRKIGGNTSNSKIITNKIENLICAYNKLPESCKAFDLATQEIFSTQYNEQRSLRINQQRFDLEIWQPIEYVLGNLFFDLKNLYQKVDELLYELDDDSDPYLSIDTASSLQMLKQTITELLTTAQIILDGKDIQTNEEYVIWLEKSTIYVNNISKETIEWWISPSDIRPLLNKYVYSDKDAIIFTSATMSTGNDFSYFRKELGLDLQELPIQSCLLPSPFDYEHNALLFLANDIDDFTKTSEYLITQQIAEAIAKLVIVTQGRALVLFTSYQQLNTVYRLLKPLLHNSGIQLLAHGISGGRSIILENLQKNPRTCVLGVNSFWEGVDIKGANLSLLIIVRLPFAPPNTPILEAKFDIIKQNGGNPFRDYSLPQAIIRFKQGFGRLIRSKEDRGICCVFDQRIWRQRSYGKKFLEALPNLPTKCCSIDDMILEIKKNWQEY